MPRTEAPVTLESGDRLNRAEFHRRYCALPWVKKAELVLGVVYVGSPVRFTVHAKQHLLAGGWLTTYIVSRPDLSAADNATLTIDDETEVQPDLCLFRTDSGAVRITEDGYLEGAPELVLEIAASSVSYDLHDKLEAYRRAGVREYLVWRVLDGAFDWRVLGDDGYRLLAPGADGMLTSTVFPGLRLHLPSLLAGDGAAVLRHVQGGATGGQDA